MKKMDIKTNDPFPIDVSVQNYGNQQVPKTESKYETENAKIAKRLENFKLDKEMNVLELSSLVKKNLDSQPELLAML